MKKSRIHSSRFVLIFSLTDWINVECELYLSVDFLLQEFRDHTDDTTVYLDIIMSEENLLMAKQEGLLKKFKLTTTISTSNMHLFDSQGIIKKFDNPEQSM